MKRIISLCFAGFFATSLLAQSNVAAGIKFYGGSWKELLDSAGKSNKMIFVDVYTDWCGPCKYMDKHIFSQQAVGRKYNETFLSYKLNAEKEEGIDLAKKYAVGAYPTFLFLNSAGYLIYKVVGEREEKDFVNLVTEAKKQEADANNLGNMEQMFSNGNRDPLFLRSYLERLAEMQMNNNEALDAYFNILTDEQLNQDSTMIYLARHIKGTGTIVASYFIDHYDQLAETSKAKITNVLFGNLIRRQGIQSLSEKRLLEYSMLRKFSDKLVGLDSRQKSILNRLDLIYGGLVKDYDLIKKAGYAYTRGLLSIPIDSIRREDQRRFEKAMQPFVSGELDSTKIDDFEEEKKYMINIYSREISSKLHETAEAFTRLPSAEKQALKDALTWATKCGELMQDPKVFKKNIETLERKINE